MTLKVGDLIPVGASGNVKASEVLEGRTFSSDEGVDLVGTKKDRGNLVITPNKNIQTFGGGSYSGIKVNALDNNVLQNNFPNLRPENIIEGVNIGGVEGINPKLIKKGETFALKDFKKGFTVEIKVPNKVEKEDGIPTYDDTSTYRLYVSLFAKSSNGNYEFSNAVKFYHWGSDKNLMIESSYKDDNFTNFGNGSYRLEFRGGQTYTVYDLSVFISFELHKGYSIITLSLHNFPETNEQIGDAKLVYNLEYVSKL